MKRIIIICLLLVLASTSWVSAAAIGPARVRFAEGEILFRTPDADEWLPAAVNTPLDEGDAFWCPAGSRAEIQLPDGSMVRLDGGSELLVLANEDGFTHLHLASGHLYLRTFQTAGENSLQIDADDTTVLPSARTRLRIDMLPNRLEDVAILKGSAHVEGSGGRTRVRAGEHILLEEGHSEIFPLKPVDNWEAWNAERDRAQSQPAKADSYLPEELRGHAVELDANGTWVNVPEYGMVWRPTVIISNDWAPYRDGRWIWKGDDYVWLPYETWGWVPYHYGRWAVVGGFGWCWVPPVRGDVYWGPGYVGWYRTGSHVGWTPLAPGEVFYGHRNYGRHSMNVTSININTNTVVYRNRTKTGGLTILPHNDFLRGKSAIHQPFRGSSVPVAVSAGSPRIQPLRESRMPIVKQTPPRVAPPRIEHRDTHEMRNRFPRVTPESAAEKHRQQPVPLTAAPAAPANRPALVREKQVTFPVVAPAERPAAKVPVSPPHRAEQPRQNAAPQVGGQNRPAAGLSRAEERHGTTSAPAAVQPQTGAPQRTEQQRRVSATKEKPQKKVWNVTTPDNGGERDSRERDNRGRDRREK